MTSNPTPDEHDMAGFTAFMGSEEEWQAHKAKPEPIGVRGCSCGMADYGAPGHDGETDGRPSLIPFYVTFGVQYRYQDHPYWKGADPSGWVTIMAPSYDKAMALVHAYFGDRYAFIYPADKFDTTADRKWYPKGELAVLTLGDLTIEGDGPKPIVTTSESWLYGVGDNAIVAARLVGRLKGAESDSHEKLGYDVEVVHLHCLDGAIELFAVVENIDRHVHAFELDWAVPNECPVCDISIT